MRDEATTVDIGPVNLEGEGDIDRSRDARGGTVAPATTATGTVAGEDGRVAEGPRPHIRLLHGMRRPANWLQLFRFAVVGASGFAINLVLYSLFVKTLGINYLVAEAAAWIIAGVNNFFWNRHWTFDAREGQIHGQAYRFLLVSLVALGINEAVLRGLVETAGLDKLLAEFLALAVATPFNFLGNKLWSFRSDLRADLYSDPSPPQEN
jgi:putative flippase GtrA